MDTGLLDMIGTAVAVILTLFVFSYLLGDNLLYRLAEHLFVGVVVGYGAVVAFHSVLITRLLDPLFQAVSEGNGGQALLKLLSLVLGLLLLFKPARRLSGLGNLSVAVLIGVGAALAIGGAVLGTLVPQVDATADLTRYVNRYGPGLGLFSGFVVLAGTTGALLHFYFSRGGEGRLAGLRQRLVVSWGGLGRWFILISFGAILAVTFLSRLSLLVGRIEFVLDSVRRLVGG